ncbi:N-methyl-L-tryptophan oxidase [Virgibacillus halophilus]|uniref:N-methyl-L-tryptophan oxidase n=1 Tax=Tigheibacillus halophilus TaxID=361280 RepID=A0ABU5C2D5_9BACI|nr:N-methyl-L-tryptophan oxidase [Virgibacillus halophilus]
MKKHYSVIVVGAGSMGMAAGYYLGKKGIDTLLIDAYDPPHNMASHHGETRLIRHAPAEGEQYAPLVLRAQELWFDLEKASNRKLFYPTGTLLAGEENAPFIADTIKVAKKFSLPMERLQPAEIEKRWPQFSIPENYIGYLEPDSGVLLNQDIILAYKTLAKSHQVAIQTNCPVTEIIPSNSGITVKTRQNTFYADRIAICTGAWTGKILKDIRLPLQTVRKTFGWFETNDVSFQPPLLPCFYFNCNQQKYYGFPDITGSGVKVGRNDSEKDVDPEDMVQDFGKYPNDQKRSCHIR